LVSLPQNVCTWGSIRTMFGRGEKMPHLVCGGTRVVRDAHGDSGSLGESFENVSVISSSYSSDLTYRCFPPNKPPIPPRLPERPNKSQTKASAGTTSMTHTPATSPSRSPLPLPLTGLPSSSSTTSSRRMPPPPLPSFNIYR
jgi:hypothetical protein